MGFGVWGLGFGVWGLGFGVWGLGFGVWGLGFGVWGLGFGVWGWGSDPELATTPAPCTVLDTYISKTKWWANLMKAVGLGSGLWAL